MSAGVISPEAGCTAASASLARFAPKRDLRDCPEDVAALSRIAEDQHPDVTFSKGDLVIFSSRTIPGNEKAVGRVINGLVRQGIDRRRILALTFTKKAADEMRSRIATALDLPKYSGFRFLKIHWRDVQTSGEQRIGHQFGVRTVGNRSNRQFCLEWRP